MIALEGSGNVSLSWIAGSEVWGWTYCTRFSSTSPPPTQMTVRVDPGTQGFICHFAFFNAFYPVHAINSNISFPFVYFLVIFDLKGREGDPLPFSPFQVTAPLKNWILTTVHSYLRIGVELESWGRLVLSLSASDSVLDDVEVGSWYIWGNQHVNLGTLRYMVL